MYSYVETELSCLLIYSISLLAYANYNPFMDSVLYTVDWPGPLAATNDLADSTISDDENSIFITTPAKEKYKCLIPEVSSKDAQNEAIYYTGPAEHALLEPLFKLPSCSYRIELYWTYELCHGQHLRQYHEEKEMGKKSKKQEYFLGRFDRNLTPFPDATTTPAVNVLEKLKNAPTVKVEHFDLPFYQMNFTGGTFCDLTQRPRLVSARYVCFEEGKGEIYELKETSTCEYEVIVLTSLMCKHPVYRPAKDPINKILCHALSPSPTLPISLRTQEQERLNELRDNFELWDAVKEAMEELAESEREEEERMQRHRRRKPPAPEIPQQSTNKRISTPVSAITDRQMLRNFLVGECVQGGSGWWKYELCFLDKVIQFHEEPDSRTTIVLGKWNELEHLEWLRLNPTKVPKPAAERKHISLYFGNGDRCELSGKPRWVEVKLKCIENPKEPHSVGIYLVEPYLCSYILVVESQIICPIVLQSDENGLTHNLEF